jgi:FeS assembly SUF system protein
MTAETREPLEGTPLIKPSTTDHPLYGEVVEACRTVYDPEIPVNIYDLGLVYRITIGAEGDVEIDMTLTAPGCPVAGDIVRSVEQAVQDAEGVGSVRVTLLFEPPWDKSKMSEDVKLELGLL